MTVPLFGEGAKQELVVIEKGAGDAYVQESLAESGYDLLWS